MSDQVFMEGRSLKFGSRYHVQAGDPAFRRSSLRAEELAEAGGSMA
jgi:hypothetical protein